MGAGCLTRIAVNLPRRQAFASAGSQLSSAASAPLSSSQPGVQSRRAVEKTGPRAFSSGFAPAPGSAAHSRTAANPPHRHAFPTTRGQPFPPPSQAQPPLLGWTSLQPLCAAEPGAGAKPGCEVEARGMFVSCWLLGIEIDAGEKNKKSRVRRRG